MKRRAAVPTYGQTPRDEKRTYPYSRIRTNALVAIVIASLIVAICLMVRPLWTVS
jgi:Co/Zn/Cd efflux system component